MGNVSTLSSESINQSFLAMDFASRYQNMGLRDFLGRKRKDELQIEDSFTDSNFAVPPGLDVSWE